MQYKTVGTGVKKQWKRYWLIMTIPRIEAKMFAFTYKVYLVDALNVRFDLLRVDKYLLNLVQLKRWLLHKYLKINNSTFRLFVQKAIMVKRNLHLVIVILPNRNWSMSREMLPQSFLLG